jgi:hypothetical protein
MGTAHEYTLRVILSGLRFAVWGINIVKLLSRSRRGRLFPQPPIALKG